MSQSPILIYSDSPCLPSGLGRITRDLAQWIAQDLPQFRVGTFGRAGLGGRGLPFMQYNFGPTGEDQWGAQYLEAAWRDFSGDQPGIIFTIQDPSRMLWFSRPDMLADSPLKKFLRSGAFKRWGYFPVDSTGPGGRLSGKCRAALQGYDRILAYTKFGADILAQSVNAPVDWIPHGIDLDIFLSHPKTAARIATGFDTSHIVVGCNMTNQARKDWGLWANVCALLKRRDHRYRFWANTDVLERHWSLPALIDDYGLEDVVKVTFCGQHTDEELSYFYSACDVTILPSLGEGFGYPIVESMACGVPCIHGDYGGGAYLIPEEWRVPVQAWRLETPFNCLRPVFDPGQWVERIMNGPEPSWTRSSVEHLAWQQLWPACWRKWFIEGL